jgi:hypothetical protein
LGKEEVLGGMMNIAVVILVMVLSAIAGLLYRMGGAAGFNTKFRDLGCPTLGLLLLWVTDGFHLPLWWAYLLCFGLYFGSLTTYWKKKGTDAHWYNWIFTGLGYSIAFLPYAIATGHWVGFAIRTIVVTFGIMFWSEKIGNVVWEESGRGVISTITLPLLLI